MKAFIPILAAIIIAVGSPVFAADHEALLRELRDHPARSISTWSSLLGKGARERVLPAPAVVVDYLRKDNEINGYKERPREAAVDPSFLRGIHAAVDELPAMVKRHLEEHVVALFLVQELGTTGYGELLRDFETNKRGFIVLDVDFLNRKANAWISWRENSPFRGAGVYTVEAVIESEAQDSRKAAIQYILLHELGHLVGVAKGAHPNWFAGGDPQGWPFAELSWLTHREVFKGESRYDGSFRNRAAVKFYAFGEAPLTSEAIGETYRELARTDFVSLYAATNMYDDFAETYAMYVHVVLQQKPWRVRISREGRVEREIEAPILDARCAKKREYLAQLFNEQNR